jgi:phosphate-selective porin OprO and OprP
MKTSMKIVLTKRAFWSSVFSVAIVFLSYAPASRANDGPPTNDELLQRIAILEQQLKELKAVVAQQQQQPQSAPTNFAPPVAAQTPTGQVPPPAASTTEAAEKSVSLTAGPEGFIFKSADSNFSIGLHGLVQFDSRTFFTDDKVKGNDSFLLRRARPIVSGTVFRDFDFLLTPEFGGNTVQILDAYVNYRLNPEFQLQVGKMKPPVGLEALQPEEWTFFNERSIATDLVPYRDIGVELHGLLFGGVVNYAAGLFNGSPDYLTTTTNNDFDNNKSFDGRVFVQPFLRTSITPLKGLGVGIAGTYQLDSGATNNANSTGLTQGYVTDGQQKFFTYSNSVASTGIHTRLTPQAYYYWGPFGVQGEYVFNNDHVSNFAKKVTSTTLENTGWEVSGGYVLTGETDSYYGVTPAHPFSPLNGRWGAVQLVGRYGQLDVDKKAFAGYADPNTSAREADAWGVGVNWYLNRNVRVNTSFSHTTFEGGNGPKATVTKQPEEVLFTRLQLVF